MSLRRDLATLGPLLGPRKLRLFCCAVCRLTWPTTGAFAEVLALAERFADGRADAHELASARFGRRNHGHPPAWAVCWSPDQDAVEMARRVLSCAEADRDRGYDEAARQAAFADLAGRRTPPAPRPSARCLAWQDATVPRLARALYDERRLDRLGVLADALTDAGCDDDALLAHLAGPGPHSLGCWALDLILGQE